MGTIGKRAKKGEEEKSMGTISKMTATEGDLKLQWNPKKPDEVAKAKEFFDKCIADGFIAFKLGFLGKRSKKLAEFDPEAKRIVLIPLMMGG